MKEESAYPVQFSVEYPESSNRLTAFFRIILAIPILVVGTFIGGAFVTGDSQVDEAIVPLLAGGSIVYCTTSDDSVPSKVSSLVVRLELGVKSLQRPSYNLRGSDERRVSVYR